MPVTGKKISISEVFFFGTSLNSATHGALAKPLTNHFSLDPANHRHWVRPSSGRWLRSLFVLLMATLVGRAEAGAGAMEPRRVVSIRSIQFEKRQLGIEAVLVIRMAQASDLPPPNSEVAGQIQFQSGIVGIIEEGKAGGSVSSRTKSWRELGKFRARRSTARDADPNELEVRTTGFHPTDRIMQLMAAATEAYAPHSQLRLRLDGQIQPMRRIFGFRRSDPATPTNLGRWSASFVASPPKDPSNEIFKSPDLFGAVGESVDAKIELVNSPNNKHR